MNEQDRAKFIESYTAVLARSWTDAQFSDLLNSDPKAALQSVGFEVPANADVVVWRHIADNAPEPSIDGAIELWELGETTGTFMMSVPPASEIPALHLREDQLDEISAGWSISCCSCTPCCCCV